MQGVPMQGMGGVGVGVGVGGLGTIGTALSSHPTHPANTTHTTQPPSVRLSEARPVLRPEMGGGLGVWLAYR